MNVNTKKFQMEHCPRQKYSVIQRTNLRYAIVRAELPMNEKTKNPHTETMLNPLGMSEICCII